MNLIKTSILTAISTVIRVGVGFVINKVVAVYAGPSALASIGQMQNFIQIVTNLANGAVSQGIVKYTAEYQTMAEKRKIFSTSIVISLVFSLLISIVMLGLSDYLSVWILKDISYSYVFVVFAVTILLFALNSVLMSILNGQKEIKKYILVNIFSSLLSLVLTSFLIMKLNVMGALYALVLNQSIVFFVTLIFVLKSDWFHLENFTQGVDKESLVKLGKFSLMALVSVMLVPLTYVFVRSYIMDSVSLNAAGYWQGMVFISNTYLMIITTSLSVYYLPRLSEIQCNQELRNEIISGFKIITPIVVSFALIIFFLKEYIILIAFTKEFMPMLDLFLWQLVGDVLKILSWLLGYIMIAKAMTKKFIYVQLIFSSSFVVLSMLFVDTFGLVGVTYAYALNYFLCLILMFVLFGGVGKNENTSLR